MASASYTEELTCSICLMIFTDPVILTCGHSFCRDCIEGSLTSQRQCPQCRSEVPEDGTGLLTSLILKNLSEKEAVRLQKDEEVDSQLCPEHEEKLKLFCVTDQKLACIICRDGDAHDGHKFKPIKEAATLVREEAETFGKQASRDVASTEALLNTQRKAITKASEKTQQLTAKIASEFQEMHKFLRKRERELTSVLKQREENAVQKMTEASTALEKALTESKKQEQKVASLLKIADPEMFLRRCKETGSVMSSKNASGSRAQDLSVVVICPSLGPYEGHLQFFVWKEMLQIIQPHEELQPIKSGNGKSGNTPVCN